MQALFFYLPLLIILLVFFLFRPFDLNFFLWNCDIFNSDCLIDYFIVFDASICLFIKALIMPAYSLILLALVCVQDVLRQVAMVGNSSYFVAVDVLSNQLLSVFDGSLLTSVDCTCRSPSDALPKADIHILRAYLRDKIPDRIYCASTVYWTLLTICILLA